MTHGLPGGGPRHVGDLGNLPAVDVAGKITLANNACMAGLRTNAIVGRGLILHSRTDTGLGASGEAGPCLAQCVLGVAKTPLPTPTVLGRWGRYGAVSRAGVRVPCS